MSNRIKANKEGIAIAKQKSANLYDELLGATKYYDDFFKSISADNVSGWSTNSTYIENVGKKIPMPQKPNPNYDASDPIKKLLSPQIDDTDEHNRLVTEAINEKAQTIKELVENLNYEEMIVSNRRKLAKFKIDIGNIDTYIKNFETFNVSFNKELEVAFSSADLGGSFVKIETIQGVDGTEVASVKLKTSEDGEYELLSEQVNCAFTFFGMASSGIVEIATLANDYASENGLYVDSAKLDELLSDYVKVTGSTTSSYLQKGFFSVATDEGIGNLYTAATGVEYNEEQVAADYNNLMAYMASDMLGMDLTEKVNSGDISASTMFGLIGSALLGKGALTDEEKEKAGLENYINNGSEQKTIGEATWPQTTDDEKKGLLAGSLGLGIGDGTTGGLIQNLIGENQEGINNGSIDLEEIEDMDIENSLQTDYEADKIFDLMDELKDSKLPSNIDPETRTVEEIDSEARDTYFEELGDDLYEERLEQIDEYQSMSEDEKTSFFEEIGYSKDEAAKLVAAPAAGQTAYVYGKLNQSLTAVSNKIAANEGITNFVSGYTDNNTMTNITNKVANADLTPVSGNVQDARQQLTVAKDNYDNSVNKANKAVDKAADAKNKYNNVLKDIQDKNGEDPKNWTDEQVDEYNEAATMYNDAVEEAQRAAEEVESAKQSYNQEKEQYQAVYDKWRDEAEEDVGMTGVEVNNSSSKPDDSNIHYNDTSSSSGGGQAENIDDSSISLDSNSSTNTGGGQVNGASQSKPGGNSGVTVDDSGLSIGNPVPDNGPTNNIETGTSTGTESVSDSSINIGGSNNVNDNIMDEYPVMEDGKPVMTEEVKPNTDGITEI